MDNPQTDKLKRIVYHSIGMVMMVFGIATYINANLGIPPGDVINATISELTPLSIGQCAILFHAFCILVQIAVRRRPTIKHAIQLPFAFVFGILLDLFLYLFASSELSSISYSFIFLIVGMLIFSFGIRIILGANIILVPPDALAKEISNALKWPVSKAKLLFDVSATSISILLSYVFEANAFLVVGIGTVICAVGTGPLIGLYIKWFPSFDL